MIFLLEKKASPSFNFAFISAIIPLRKEILFKQSYKNLNSQENKIKLKERIK